ncbi:MAG: glycosyltransferase [Vulcanimicrobiota bacterium]
MIFDEFIRVQNIFDKASSKESITIDLFSITGDFSIPEKILTRLKELDIESVNSIDSALEIHQQVLELREGIFKWSARVGNHIIDNKTVKEWFILPGSNVSTWWFGLVSEKNTAKTDVFLRIAQLRAIRNSIISKEYQLVYISIRNSIISQAIRRICRKLGKQVKIIPSSKPPFVVKGFLKDMKIDLFRESIIALSVLLKTIYYNFLAKTALKSTKRLEPQEDSLLFVTYFPYIEKAAAKDGIFRNKYTQSLQDKCRELNLPILWILMYVPIDNYSYKDALNFAKDFLKNGERIFFLEEFLNPKDVMAILYLWFRQLIISNYLYKRIKATLLSNPLIEGAEDIIKSLWYRSFCGSTSMEGILFYFMYRRLFHTIKKIDYCLYYSEMHAWEKALIAAKNKENKNIKTIGFQHASVPKNFFSYYYDKSDLIITGKAIDLPMPDLLAVNGSITYSFFQESGYKNLTIVEAIRSLYLNDILSREQLIEKESFLIAGSIDYVETKALVTLVKGAFPTAEKIRICFKGHPSLPFERVFRELQIDTSSSNYIIIKSDIFDALKNSAIVLVPSSTVAIEALAMGCEVIVPFFSNSIQMNPLADFEGFYHKVSSIQDLVQCVNDILGGKKINDRRKTRDFISNYWDLDSEIPKWSNLIEKIQNKCSNLA